MVTGKTAVTEACETFYYYLDSKDGGKALINTVKDGIVYVGDGATSLLLFVNIKCKEKNIAVQTCYGMAAK